MPTYPKSHRTKSKSFPLPLTSMNAKKQEQKFLVQPPLNPTDASISCSIGDGIEQRVRTIDRSAHAAHALIPDGRLDGGARCWIVQCHGASTVRVSIRLGTHECERQGNRHVAARVNGPAARAEA